MKNLLLILFLLSLNIAFASDGQICSDRSTTDVVNEVEDCDGSDCPEDKDKGKGTTKN